MTRNLKIVFYVEDTATKEIIGEKKQMLLDVVGTDEELQARFDEDRAAEKESRDKRREGQSVPVQRRSKYPLTLSLTDLARDHLAEMTAALAPPHEGLSDEEKAAKAAKAKEASDAKKWGDEVFMAAGDMIGRFIRIELRGWAQKQRETEPAA